MAGFFGADTASMRALARAAETGGSGLGRIADALGAAVGAVPWEGPDADRFRDRWFGEVSPRLSRAALDLTRRSQELLGHAQEQDDASAADAPGGGAHGAAPRGGVTYDPAYLGDPEGDGDKDKPTKGRSPVTIELGPDGKPKKTSGELEVGKKTPGVDVGGGAKVGGGITLTVKHVESVTDNRDGTTTTTFDSEVKVGVEGEGKLPDGTGASGGVHDGSRVKISVTVPNGVDPRSIDPMDRSTWPPGTRVRFDAEHFQGSELEIALKKTLGGAEIGGSTGGTGEDREGTSIVLEKKADGTTAVAAGPTSGFSSSGKLKLSAEAGPGGVSVEVSSSGEHSSSRFRQFSVDERTPEGREVMRRVMNGQDLPTQDTPGVTDLRDTYSTEWTKKNGIKVSAGPIEVGGEQSESSRTVVTERPGGRTEVETTWSDGKSGGAEVIRRTSSQDGSTYSEPTYETKIPIRDEGAAAEARRLTGDPTIKPGDTVTVKTTETEMERMRSHDPSFRDPAGADAQDRAALNQRYAHIVGRDGSAENVLRRMSNANHGIDPYDPSAPLPDPREMARKPLPGEVAVQRKP